MADDDDDNSDCGVTNVNCLWFNNVVELAFL